MPPKIIRESCQNLVVQKTFFFLLISLELSFLHKMGVLININHRCVTLKCVLGEKNLKSQTKKITIMFLL